MINNYTQKEKKATRQQNRCVNDQIICSNFAFLPSRIDMPMSDQTSSFSKTLFRSRLITKYQEVLQANLTMISAPAGYGKTVLLQAWYNQLKESSNIYVDFLNMRKLAISSKKFWKQFAAALGLQMEPPPDQMSGGGGVWRQTVVTSQDMD